jgi:hypothetical protein
MSSLDSCSSSSNFYMMNNNSLTKYLYLCIAFFMGVFITIISIYLMNICMRPILNDAMSRNIIDKMMELYI